MSKCGVIQVASNRFNHSPKIGNKLFRSKGLKNSVSKSTKYSTALVFINSLPLPTPK